MAETVVWLLISGSFYLVSCYLGARGGGRPGLPFILVAALAFRLTAWPLYPALSDDVFRYRWEGQLQNTGGNPYHARPNDVAWAHLRDQAFPLVPGRDFKAVYGPLAELAQAATFRAVDAFTRDPFVQAFWFKLPAALFDLGAIAMLALWLRALGLPRERLVIYAWSPLAIFEFWATGHNDAMLVFFLTAALLAAARDRWWWSYAALTLAAAVKIWPLLLFPLFVRSRGRWRELAVAPPLALVLVLPYWTSGWTGMWENVRFLSGFLGGWRNNDSLFGLLLWAAGNDAYTAKKLAFAAVGITVLVATLARWPLARAVLIAVTVMLMFSANCHAWYLTWLLPLLAVDTVAALLLWTALAPLGHAAVIGWVIAGQWRGSTPLRWLIYVPVYALLAAGPGYRWLRCAAPSSGFRASGPGASPPAGRRTPARQGPWRPQG